METPPSADAVKIKIPTVRLEIVRDGFTEYQVGDPNAASKLFQERIGSADREHLAVVYLDSAKHPVGYENIVTGGKAMACVEIRGIFTGALLAGADSIVLGHNHPSGSPEPSPEDIDLTRRCVEAGELLGISVLDHVVVTDNWFTSIRSHYSGIWTA